jgi:hypothetical protein
MKLMKDRLTGFLGKLVIRQGLLETVGQEPRGRESSSRKNSTNTKSSLAQKPIERALSGQETFPGLPASW